jgi:hypothetical protein
MNTLNVYVCQDVENIIIDYLVGDRAYWKEVYTDNVVNVVKGCSYRSLHMSWWYSDVRKKMYKDLEKRLRFDLEKRLEFKNIIF